MKSLKRFAAMVAVVMAVVTASTQTASAMGPFRFGIKAGVNVNELKFDKEIFNSENQTGFTGGITAQFVVPIIGLGVDASVMYTRRNGVFSVYDKDNNLLVDNYVNHRDYIEIPVNARWNISLPIVGQFVSPFIFTGPDFSFLTSPTTIKLPSINLSDLPSVGDLKEDLNPMEPLKNKTFDVAWNFGIGLKFVNKVEVAASYGLGITDSASGNASLYGDSKNRFWTVTAAYLF